jgi:hypothetical protein
MKTAVILCVLLLAGCATAPQPVENPRAVWCETNKPYYLPEFAIAAMDRKGKENYLAYHLQGERWCKWAP